MWGMELASADPWHRRSGLVCVFCSACCPAVSSRLRALAAGTLLAIPALWRAGRSNSGLIAFNLVAFAAVILMYVFAPVHWLEWLPAGMFLLCHSCWVFLPERWSTSPRTREPDAPFRGL